MQGHIGLVHLYTWTENSVNIMIWVISKSTLNFPCIFCLSLNHNGIFTAFPISFLQSTDTKKIPAVQRVTREINNFWK
jgi:hypothetical protein